MGKIAFSAQQTGVWEYKILRADPVYSSIEAILNTQGRAGWENYAVVGTSYYFKRFVKTVNHTVRGNV